MHQETRVGTARHGTWRRTVALARRVVGAALVAANLALLPSDAHTQAPVACASLSTLALADTRIVTAVSVPAGPFAPAGGTPLIVPAFCRVVAKVTPTMDSDIQVEVWLPVPGVWNGKLQGVGNSGWSGAIAYSAMATALQAGYATASTDTGHTGDELTFASGHPEKVTDWAHRAVHVMTVAAKQIVQAAQGRPARHAYFTGCSTGGAQGLTEAQRYPGDYDGIVAGNPGNDRTNRLASYLWAWTAAHPDGDNILPAATLTVVHNAVLAACDGLDGVTDDVIDDPRRCRFDPAVLRCDGVATSSCLTPAQVDAVKKIYDGPRNPRTGEQIFPGLPRGSESFGPTAAAGWRSYTTEPSEPRRLDFWRYFVFNDPKWDWHAFDWDRDIGLARERTRDLNATNADLGAYKTSGGKLLMYLGWNDTIHGSQQALDYYEDVTRRSGGPEATMVFARLFMVPGMGHCAPGPGPSSFDALAALDAWVERGIAPEQIIASRVVNGVVNRTRPLCPYPQVARWKGEGRSDDASHFSCVQPPTSQAAK